MATNYQEITGDGPVLRTLARVRESRSLIHVRINNKGASYNSAVIAVDRENRTWQFDELSSEEANRLLAQERKCGIESKLAGITIKFQAEISSSGSDEKGILYYQAAPPKSIQVYQRRSNFRVSLSSAQRATISFVVPGLPMIRGRVHNLSAGGVGVHFSSSTQAIGSGLQISHATITLPNGKMIGCDFNVCFVNRSNAGMSMGARFVKISKSDQKALSKFIHAVQREHVKRARSSEDYELPAVKGQKQGAGSFTLRFPFKEEIIHFLSAIKKKMTP